MRALLPLAPLLLACVGCRCEPVRGDGRRDVRAESPSPETAEREAGLVLDALHRLASEADGEAYFALFTPDAVYIGTDASERWTVEQFRAFAEPYFARGQGWTYGVTERHLRASADGRTVWFDERLDNANYGECRGSGVVVAGREGWRIAQYVLSLPVPNELARDLVQRIRARASADGGAGGGL